MKVDVYDLAVPQTVRTLEALKGTLKKAMTFCQTKKVDFSVLMAARLAPDQFPLVRQVQIATDNAKGCIGRLTSINMPKFEDNETTYEQLIARIDKTIAFLQTAKPEDFSGFETKKIEFPWMPGKQLTGYNFLVQHYLPNYHFHLTTAYSILRKNGVDIGKADFLGQQSWQ
jgi:hypothetical protein